MGIAYHVYVNDGLGGLVNYGAPLATTISPGYVTGPLPMSSDTTFAVRAFDPATGLEEANTEARVRIILDGSGQDVSARPNPPTALMVRATALGSCLASWGYSPVGQAGAPTQFLVYLTQGSMASYVNPALIVPYSPNLNRFACTLTGLADGVVYTVAVRAAGPMTTDGNINVVATVLGDSTPPMNVDGLTASATFVHR